MSKLPAASRHQTLVKLINGSSGMSISAMAEAFGVSTETIRRDLAALERGGSVQRVYGGAMPGDRGAPLEDRVNMVRPGKEAIGKLVAAMIEADQWIFMTGGSSVLAVAHAMRNGPPVSVMTNMPAIGDALQAGPRHKVVLTGGDYDATGKMLHGDAVFEAIEDCSFDLAIIGVYGVDPGFGLVERTRHNMMLKRRLATQSRDQIYVGDHSKIGALGRYRSIPFSAVGKLVTDEPLKAPFTDLFAAADSTVIHPQETPITEIASK